MSVGILDSSMKWRTVAPTDIMEIKHGFMLLNALGELASMWSWSSPVLSMHADISPGRITWCSLPLETMYDPAVPRMVFDLFLEVSFMNFDKSFGKFLSSAMTLRMLPDLHVHAAGGTDGATAKVRDKMGLM